MGVFSKSFFNFPPTDPEEPGFAQDANRTIRESHSAGKEIAELLSQYDEETITSLDGTKYNVMAQREGGDGGNIWWKPTLNLKDLKLTIADGGITAPWDDRATEDDSEGLIAKENYRFFTRTVEEQTLSEGNNYFFVTATFTERKFSAEADEETIQEELATQGDARGSIKITRQFDVYNYHATSADSFGILKSTEATQSDGLNTQQQMLGWYTIEDGEVKEHYWRTNHVIDFRPQLSSYIHFSSWDNTGVSNVPKNPNP